MGDAWPIGCCMAWIVPRPQESLRFVVRPGQRLVLQATRGVFLGRWLSPLLSLLAFNFSVFCPDHQPHCAMSCLASVQNPPRYFPPTTPDSDGDADRGRTRTRGRRLGKRACTFEQLSDRVDKQQRIMAQTGPLQGRPIFAPVSPDSSRNSPSRSPNRSASPNRQLGSLEMAHPAMAFFDKKTDLPSGPAWDLCIALNRATAARFLPSQLRHIFDEREVASALDPDLLFADSLLANMSEARTAQRVKQILERAEGCSQRRRDEAAWSAVVEKVLDLAIELHDPELPFEVLHV